MGLMDKLKAGADQARDLAEQAAAKAKEEARELQVKRELGQAEAELGRAAFALVDSGALAHPDLDEHVARVRELRAQRDERGRPADASAAPGDGGEEARPASQDPPATPS